MSNIMNKVKDTVMGPSDPAENPKESSAPHSSSAAKTADSDREHSRNVGMRHDNNFGSTTAGPHQSNVANRDDPHVDSDLDKRRNMGARGTGPTHATTTGTTTGTGYGGSTNTGVAPHQSNIANKLDPRIDSDRDDRGAATSTSGAFGTKHTGTSTSTDAGDPHQSNIANKTDPRVDSDRDHRGTAAGTTGPFPTGATGTSTNTGPHSSGAANKLDPRIESDRDHRSTNTTGAFGTGHTGGSGPTNTSSLPGATTGGTGTTGAFKSGTVGTTGTAGTTATGPPPHKSNVAYKPDPKTDSDRDHRSKQAISKTGPAPNTAGPHKSDIMNKLDPRVDSDLDGSKTVGGNKTHQY